jgi:dihydrofolate synthase/folylpolyglutamate synthase
LNPATTLPTSLDAWLEYIEALHSKDIELGLQRVSAVAQRLALSSQFPIITVAGTNGKGSTCAMLAQIYQAAGYRVACYSSPHLISYQERIRINQQMISAADACAAFAAVEQARLDTPLTYFEFGTLAAMWHFQQQQVDVAVLEIGMGGRLDAVNIFEPDCSIVTSIDLDHMEYLGDTREAIGREKAGIFRAHKPAICADHQPPQSLLNYAAELSSELYLIDHQFSYQTQGQHWHFSSVLGRFDDLPMPSLKGQFQLDNASAVLMALQVMQTSLPIQPQVIQQSLPNILLAGRFQVLRERPQVIVDVAHNPHAAKALASNLQETAVTGKTIAVMAMLADKDIAQVVAILRPYMDSWHIAALQHARAATQQELLQALQAAQIEAIQPHQNIAIAFQQAYKQAAENDRIIVFGSFFTVAAIMRILLD